MQVFGDHEAEHAVAEKFETFIGDLCIGAGMGERAPQKVAIGEAMAKAFFKLR
jgi:hypothetical protein